MPENNCVHYEGRKKTISCEQILTFAQMTNNCFSESIAAQQQRNRAIINKEGGKKGKGGERRGKEGKGGERRGKEGERRGKEGKGGERRERRGFFLIGRRCIAIKKVSQFYNNKGIGQS